MSDFDAEAKEQALRAESEAWDTSAPIDAEAGDIPVIDVSAYLESRSVDDLRSIAGQLGHACETVGFWQLVGHGIDAARIRSVFDAIASFHALPLETKEEIRMDRPGWPLGGVGYLPVGNRKLPARATGNLNEAFIIKGDRDISSKDNQWLGESELPGFRETIEDFAAELEDLTLRLLPMYAAALGLEADWFAPGFEHPFWRLRMTHYPPSPSDQSDGEGAKRTTMSADRKSREQYGIAPHVDTTFFTLLLQNAPGLTIYHTPKDRWINVPVVENAFVVNSGELLRQWTNDRFLSVRHYADAGDTGADAGDTGANAGDASRDQRSRYSIPFFVNATRDFVMECIPTCCNEDNPAKYPPISYNQSQGVVQGE